MEYAALLANHT
jgi:hypothetical protein